MNGWVVGLSGFVAHSVDGGDTWTPQLSGVSADLRAVRFASKTDGVAVGDSGTVLVTRDGGDHWSAVPVPATAAIRAAAVSADTWVLAGDAGALLVSNDRGATFALSHVGGVDLHGVATDDGASLVLAAGVDGSIWASSDRGATFVREATLGGRLEAIGVQPQGAYALAVGAAGLIAERDASGRWIQVVSGTNSDLFAVLVPDDQDSGNAYAAGAAGTLLTRSSGGTPFVAVASGTTADLMSLDDL
jgi:photosystem II stability/assembly factor-like uncharacterized protein